MAITKISIRIDNREWHQELPGNASDDQVQAAIRDITEAYPVYTRKLVHVERTGWVAHYLAPIADGWLAINPIARGVLFAASVALIVAGLVL